jgi:type I restriction enzyme R subunit
MKPDIELSKADRKKVKAVARKLLQTLKETKLVLDWRKKLKTRADVISTVRKVLDDLPRVFTNDLYDQKCDVVFQHIYDSYMGEGESIYGNASPNEGLVKYNRI